MKGKFGLFEFDRAMPAIGFGISPTGWHVVDFMGSAFGGGVLLMVILPNARRGAMDIPLPV